MPKRIDKPVPAKKAPAPAPEPVSIYSVTTLTTRLTKPRLVEIGAHYGLQFKESMSKSEMIPGILSAQDKAQGRG